MFQLVYARAALDVAQRALDELRATPIEGPLFSDRAPIVLERLLEVTRQINAEAKQRQKTHPRPNFSTWWGQVPNPVREYRNVMLKGDRRDPGGWEQRTRVEVTTTFPNGASVTTSDLRVKMEDGKAVYVRDVIKLPETARAVWYFRDGPWHDRPVIETLEQHLVELRDDIIPEAEQFLS